MDRAQADGGLPGFLGVFQRHHRGTALYEIFHYALRFLDAAFPSARESKADGGEFHEMG